MALVHTSFHANPLENSRLSQRELLARIFGQHGEDEHVHEMDYEESSSDSGSDYEMEEYHEGMIYVFFLKKCTLEETLWGILFIKSGEGFVLESVKQQTIWPKAKLPIFHWTHFNGNKY